MSMQDYDRCASERVDMPRKIICMLVFFVCIIII